MAGTPITMTIAAWFLYSLIGYSAFVGYLTFIAVRRRDVSSARQALTAAFQVLPFSYFVTKKMMNLQRTVMQTRDLRMRSINELLQSIKARHRLWCQGVQTNVDSTQFVKFSAWETRWIARILGFRESELALLLRSKLVRSVFQIVWRVVPIVISCIDLAWFTGVAGGQLTVSLAFPAISALGYLTAELNFVRRAELCHCYCC